MAWVTVDRVRSAALPVTRPLPPRPTAAARCEVTACAYDFRAPNARKFGSFLGVTPRECPIDVKVGFGTGSGRKDRCSRASPMLRRTRALPSVTWPLRGAQPNAGEPAG